MIGRKSFWHTLTKPVTSSNGIGSKKIQKQQKYKLNPSISDAINFIATKSAKPRKINVWFVTNRRMTDSQIDNGWNGSKKRRWVFSSGCRKNLPENQLISNWSYLVSWSISSFTHRSASSKDIGWRCQEIHFINLRGLM